MEGSVEVEQTLAEKNVTEELLHDAEAGADEETADVMWETEMYLDATKTGLSLEEVALVIFGILPSSCELKKKSNDYFTTSQNICMTLHFIMHSFPSTGLASVQADRRKNPELRKKNPRCEHSHRQE